MTDVTSIQAPRSTLLTEASESHTREASLEIIERETEETTADSSGHIVKRRKKSTATQDVFEIFDELEGKKYKCRICTSVLFSHWF
jgi:hypothetical protein